MREQGGQQTRLFYELCSMIIHILRSPPLPSLVGLSSISVAGAPSSRGVPSSSSHVSPTAFASLFLGISIALMLLGSVTFVIGFILMPVVIGLVFLFYFVGILSNLSDFGRTFLCPANDVSMRVLVGWVITVVLWCQHIAS